MPFYNYKNYLFWKIMMKNIRSFEKQLWNYKLTLKSLFKWKKVKNDKSKKLCKNVKPYMKMDKQIYQIWWHWNWRI